MQIYLGQKHQMMDKWLPMYKLNVLLFTTMSQCLSAFEKGKENLHISYKNLLIYFSHYPLMYHHLYILYLLPSLFELPTLLSLTSVHPPHISHISIATGRQFSFNCH